MSKIIFKEKYPKPEIYSDDSWYEVAKLLEKANSSPDHYVGLWFLRQAMPFVMKQKIELYDLEHVLDFFLSQSTEKPVRLGKISYLEAVRQANAWTELENKRAKRKLLFKENEKDIQVIFEYENDTWVKLISSDAYKREGINMVHCVGDYVDRKAIIYSLRDENNEPHCTIEVSDKKIKQIKGKNNKLVILKYHKSLFAFLSNIGLNIDTHDLEQYGFVICKEGFFDADNLPDEVHILNERTLRLGQNARIPKVLVASKVEIKSPRNLNLSLWRVGSLDIEGKGQNLTLPEKVRNLNINNINLIKEEVNVTNIHITNGSLITKILRCDNFNGKNSKIETEIFDGKNFMVDGSSQIKCNDFNCWIFSNVDSSGKSKEQVNSNIIANKIFVKEELKLECDQSLAELILKIETSPETTIEIRNIGKNKLVLPWTDIQQLTVFGDDNLYDFSKITYLAAFKRIISDSNSVVVLGYRRDPKTDRIQNISDIINNRPNKLVYLIDYYKVESEKYKKS